MHEIVNVINHPDYDQPRGKSPKNDLCILKTMRSMNTKFDPAAKPACLPERRQTVPEGTICWTAGWGKTKFLGNLGQIMDCCSGSLVRSKSPRPFNRG